MYNFDYFLTYVLAYLSDLQFFMGLSQWLNGKESTCNTREAETQISPLGQENPMEREEATHSGILAWKIPCTEGYSPRGSQKSQTQMSNEITTILYINLPFLL